MTSTTQTISVDQSALLAASQLIHLRKGAWPDNTKTNSSTSKSLSPQRRPGNQLRDPSPEDSDSERCRHFANAFESAGSQVQQFNAKLRELRAILRDVSLKEYRAVFLKTTTELTSQLLHWIAQTHERALFNQDLQREHEIYSCRLADFKRELELECDDPANPPKAKRARKTLLPLTETLLHPGNSARVKAKKLTPIISDVAQHLLTTNTVSSKKLERVQKTVFIAATSTLFGISPTKPHHRLGK